MKNIIDLKLLNEKDLIDKTYHVKFICHFNQGAVMKLYYSKGACSLAIRILIHEMNIGCEFVLVNLKKNF